MKTYIKLLIFLCSINLIAQNNTIFVQPITATKPYQGVFGSATLQIDDAGSDGLITNPLIIAEGLDTGLMAQAGRIGDTDITTFIRNVNDPNSLNLEELLTGGTDLIFGDQNYDIIYVNWNNGTDFIQRNAYVLEAVIAWVNTQKAISGSTNKNVVLGQSMGGLIARYALRDMENTGLNHDTGLYISHDAPHQGAHVPLGMLYMARHVVNEFIQTPLGNITIPVDNVGNVGLATIDDLLDAPAINQMLLNTVDTNGNRTNSVNVAWQNELRLFGYPQQTRNIALSNASHCASSQGLVSNQELVTVAGNGGTSVLTSVLMYLFVNFDPLIGIALNDVSAALLGFLPGNSKLDVEFRAKAFPAAGVAQIYKGRLTYEKKFLWLIKITRTIFNKSENSWTSDKFIDNYPGGVTPNTLSISGNGGNSNWFYNYDYNLNVNLNFNFIPATSALDVGSGNVTLTNSDYFIKYTAASPPTGNRTIPFNNFTTSYNQNNSLNAPHISFNRRNGDWLATELDNVTSNNDIFDCTYICSGNVITGPETLCSTATYSGPNGGTFSNWTITHGVTLVTLTGNGTPNVTLTALPNVFGQVTLTYSTGDNGARCGNITLTKTIWVGLPQFNEFTFGSGLSQNPCIAPIDCLTSGLPSTEIFASFTGLSTTEFNNNANWEWVRYNNFIFLNSSRNRATICPLAIGNSGFKVRVKNACGWSEWVDYPSFDITSCSDNGISSSNIYTVYPNPSQDIVTIDLRDQNNQPDNTKKITGELFNILGITKSKIQINNNKATFSVAGLTKGIYVLKIYINDQVESHQIAVN